MNVTVVGATGLIGRHLCATLAAAGHEVTAVSRSGRPVDGAHPIAWDPAAGPMPATAVDGRDVVVNLAGAGIGDGRWSESRKREIVESRRAATDGIVAALASPTSPRVLVNASAVGYYGTGEATVDESHGPGDDFLARTCVQWEQSAEAARAHGVRVALVRFGVVLSADGGALAKQLTPFKAGVGGPLGGGRQWVSWVHIDDAVGVVILAATREVSGPINAVAPHPVRQAEFARALGAALHRPAVVPTPAFVLRLAMGEMATLALDGQRVMPTVAEELGYPFAYTDIGPALEAAVSRA